MNEVEQRAFATIEALLLQMVEHQEQKVAAFARRLRPRLTADDLKNPHDFDELNDPDFNYEDGHLAGLHAAVSALRRAVRDHHETHAGGPNDSQR
ncbi:MAG: hypothetical protein Q8Q09_25400 [Deltaproteobacteria bacterium]|nr:hypothetical protein [Deltaproteobacteria bacterium]